MRPIDTFKLLLALCAVLLLGYGIRSEAPQYRWAGIACLALAVCLRFIKPNRRLD
jgi:hypothetical protein